MSTDKEEVWFTYPFMKSTKGQLFMDFKGDANVSIENCLDNGDTAECRKKLRSAVEETDEEKDDFWPVLRFHKDNLTTYVAKYNGPDKDPDYFLCQPGDDECFKRLHNAICPSSVCPTVSCPAQKECPANNSTCPVNTCPDNSIVIIIIIIICVILMFVFAFFSWFLTKKHFTKNKSREE
jgi:hypothetical protein